MEMSQLWEAILIEVLKGVNIVLGQLGWERFCGFFRLVEFC